MMYFSRFFFMCKKQKPSQMNVSWVIPSIPIRREQYGARISPVKSFQTSSIAKGKLRAREGQIQVVLPSSRIMTWIRNLALFTSFYLQGLCNQVNVQVNVLHKVDRGSRWKIKSTWLEAFFDFSSCFIPFSFQSIPISLCWWGGGGGHQNLTCTSDIGFTFYVEPPVEWGSTYCFTAVSVGVGVGVLVGVGVGVTSITKAPPAQIFFGWHVFCSPGHWLLISAMTLTFWVKVKR